MVSGVFCTFQTTCFERWFFRGARLSDTGVSDAVARELAGHDSAIVNRNYTHLDDKTTRLAVDRLPDILK